MEQAISLVTHWHPIKPGPNLHCYYLAHPRTRESVFDTFCPPVLPADQRMYPSLATEQWSESTFQGHPRSPSSSTKKKVLSYVDIGKAQGAQLIVGGEAYSNSNSNSGSGSGTANGYYFGQATPSSPTCRLACASTAQENLRTFLSSWLPSRAKRQAMDLVSSH